MECTLLSRIFGGAVENASIWMKESNAGSLMELLTNTMDWGEALARAMIVNRDSANMIVEEALKLGIAVQLKMVN